MPDARLLWLLLLVAGALLYLWLAAALVRRRTGPGSRTMGLALCAVAVWLAATVAEVLVPGERAYLAAVGVKYTAVALTPPAFLLFIAHYTERYTIRRRHLAILFLVPAATIAAVWTNPWHGWMWAHPPLGPHGERLARLAWGPWFRFVHLPVSYATALAGVLAALVELFAQSKLYRAQTAMLIVAVLIPFAANVAFTAGYGSARFGPTPIAFALSGTLLAWGFVRLRIFQLSPIAYHSIFDHMRDGVVVVDRYRRIVDANPAALSLAGRSEAELSATASRKRCPGGTPSSPRSTARAAAPTPAGRPTGARSSSTSRPSGRAASAPSARSCCCGTSPSATGRRPRSARARRACGA